MFQMMARKTKLQRYHFGTIQNFISNNSVKYRNIRLYSFIKMWSCYQSFGWDDTHMIVYMYNSIYFFWDKLTIRMTPTWLYICIYDSIFFHQLRDFFVKWTKIFQTSTVCLIYLTDSNWYMIHAWHLTDTNIAIEDLITKRAWFTSIWTIS